MHHFAKVTSLLLLTALVASCDGSKSSTSTSVNVAATPAPPAPPPQPPRPPQKPVDLKLTKLDDSTGQFGHDPQKIIQAILGLDLRQGQYENDAKFKARLKAMESAPLYDELSVGSLIAFNLQNVRFTYDANKEQWAYEVTPHRISYTFNVFSVSSTYIGNAAAWAARYPGRDVEEWATIAVELPELKGLSYIRGAYPVPPERAPELDNGLDVLLIGKLLPPYYSTMQVLPRESQDRRVDMVRMMPVKIAGVWIVNRRTGDVVSKKWSLKTY